MADLPSDELIDLSKTLVLWDVDHTLIENGGVSKATYARAYELLTGQPPAVRPVTDGRTDFQIMRELLEANLVRTYGYVRTDQFESVLVQAMKEHAPELPKRGYILPGIVQALAALASMPGLIQSVLTGNIKPNAQAKLRAFDLDMQVDLDVGGFGSDATVRSRLVDVARSRVAAKYSVQFDRTSTVLIGDTPRDVKAAHEGGAKVIAVATGSYSVDQLRDAGADAVLSTIADLDRFVVTLAEVRRRGC